MGQGNRPTKVWFARCGPTRGITLMELMIVIVIIGILAIISIPTYLGYKERTHRNEALNGMGQMYANQENWRNLNPAAGFTADLDALGFAGGCTANCVYLVSFEVAPDMQTYRARFVPNPAGGTNDVNQMSDEDCSWFTIDATGHRDAENPRCLESR